MDFTLAKYKELLLALMESGMDFTLRHDVDRCPRRSVAVARVEKALGLKAVYYFRCVPESNDPYAIRQIVALGHEIGYHYEDMSIAKGDPEKAILHFEQWLTYFRQFYPVHHICMHGAPTSCWDGRDLWKTCDYRQYGVDYEPYFDEDYSSKLYLTDTGRCWDGWKVSLRDKVPQQQDYIQQGLVFHTTDQVIAALSNPNSPLRKSPYQTICFTTHPQRWTESNAAWLKEWITQSIKNIIKAILVKKHS